MSTRSDESRFLALEEARLRLETSHSFSRLRAAITAVPKRLLSSATTTIKAHPAAAGGAATGLVGVVGLIWWLRASRRPRPALAPAGYPGYHSARLSGAGKSRRGGRGLGGWINLAMQASHLISTLTAVLYAKREATPRSRKSRQSIEPSAS